MNGATYIQERQRLWAERRGVGLIGSQGDRGRASYTTTLDQNLFEPLSPDARDQIAEGDGNELGQGNGVPGKMQAVHSSSALAVNVFHYWQRIGAVAEIARTCKLPASAVKRICFECKWSIAPSFRYAPNIDVVIYNDDASPEKVSAIECKFGEAYSGYGHKGLDPKYLALSDLWADIPRLRQLAESVSPEDARFPHLHPAQLLKHILALKRAYGRSGFRLMYLWYDVSGEEGMQHRKEVEQFAEAATTDGIKFQSITYQQLIVSIAGRLRPVHQPYVDYLTERYL